MEQAGRARTSEVHVVKVVEIGCEGPQGSTHLLATTVSFHDVLLILRILFYSFTLTARPTRSRSSNSSGTCFQKDGLVSPTSSFVFSSRPNHLRPCSR